MCVCDEMILATLKEKNRQVSVSLKHMSQKKKEKKVTEESIQYGSIYLKFKAIKVNHIWLTDTVRGG